MDTLSTIEQTDRLGKTVAGLTHNIGAGFSALHFSEEMFGTAMDPLLMVDHFVMTAPTFAPHLHAGISAVTAMFEDAEGGFLNRDTLGHNLTLRAGDLYWLTAASGAAHEERPEEGARVHALQIFVNLPARLKKDPARALHVPGQDVPVLQGPGHRVRVVLGSSGGATGAQGTPQEMTLLDGFLAPHGRYAHRLPEGRQAWVYAVSGSLAVSVQGSVRTLSAGQATTVAAGPDADVALEAGEASHFVLMAGRPIRETFVKHGPLVMASTDDVRQTLTDYANGRFGRVPS
ncbi:pirin family protein [Bordetella genomosp. 13]|uniref:pirin family protein n=1 Tax=Bordetella genomosp. 13 TaxID=463040 RepID=UPI0011A23A93|nr:pirin-like C-terminal cupin domain-containing protein [Bordetella genomosp. 13]